MNRISRNFLCNLNCCSYNNQSSLILKDWDETYKVNMYYLFGEGFENKAKLDCTNPIDHIFFFRIFGIGSINGIQCIHEYENCGPIVLWNPATQAIKINPPSFLESIEFSIAGVAKEFVIVIGSTTISSFVLYVISKVNYEIDFRTPCRKIYTWMNSGRYIV